MGQRRFGRRYGQMGAISQKSDADNLKTHLPRFVQHNKSRFAASMVVPPPPPPSPLEYLQVVYYIRWRVQGKGENERLLILLLFYCVSASRMMNHFISGIPISPRFLSDGLIGRIRGTSLSGYRSEEGHKCIALNLLAFAGGRHIFLPNRFYIFLSTASLQRRV